MKKSFIIKEIESLLNLSFKLGNGNYYYFDNFKKHSRLKICFWNKLGIIEKYKLESLAANLESCNNIKFSNSGYYCYLYFNANIKLSNIKNAVIEIK